MPGKDGSLCKEFAAGMRRENLCGLKQRSIKQIRIGRLAVLLLGSCSQDNSQKKTSGNPQQRIGGPCEGAIMPPHVHRVVKEPIRLITVSLIPCSKAIIS